MEDFPIILKSGLLLTLDEFLLLLWLRQGNVIGPVESKTEEEVGDS